MKRAASFAAASIFALMGLHAADVPVLSKRTLNSNRTLLYNVVPPSVDSLDDMLREGVFYGRVRLNTFRWDWKEERYTTRSGYRIGTKDNWAAAVGGSLTYKSAYLHGFGVTLDGYTSQNPWHVSEYDVATVKAGKDAFSRHDVLESGDWHMNVLAQLFAEYRVSQTSVKYGRQKFESFLTKSNDTKMIPNTFEGFSLVSEDLKNHTFKLAWFTKQKLRDHTRFHDPMTFADISLSGLPTKEKLIHAWAANDDSGMNKGLSWSNYDKAGESKEHDLLVAEVWSRAVPHFKAMVNVTAVPDVLSSLTLEGHYTFEAGDWRIVPGARWMNQFDNGGGKVGGASLTGLASPIYLSENRNLSVEGYDDTDSLDGWLVAFRIDVKRKDAPWKWRIAYSRVGDEADIVAPWRGFPTGGFTRAMGQYNWYADTETWMVRGDYDFGKAGLVPGLKAMFRLAYEDYDQSKKLVDAAKPDRPVYLEPSDRTVLHLDAIQKISALPGLEARVRMAFVKADKVYDTDFSYNEYRFEMNYLF